MSAATCPECQGTGKGVFPHCFECHGTGIQGLLEMPPEHRDFQRALNLSLEAAAARAELDALFNRNKRLWHLLWNFAFKADQQSIDCWRVNALQMRLQARQIQSRAA